MTKQKDDSQNIESQIMEDVKKMQADEIRLARSRRMQRLILKGEWLDRYEQQLKVIQSIFCNAVDEWSENEGEEADTVFTYQIMDAVHLYMEVTRSLRYSCFCPKKERDGILYMHDGIEDNKTVFELINLKDLSRVQSNSGDDATTKS